MSVAVLLEMAADAAPDRVGIGPIDGGLQDWVRRHLRTARTPSRVEFFAALPFTDTGKLLRRAVRSEFLDPGRTSAERADDRAT